MPRDGVDTSPSIIAATYAAARLLAGINTGDRLQVLGRTSQSDGGQGLFTWVAGGTTTVDEGYVLQATGGTWQRQDPSPTVGETLLNAVWFNIKPTNADTVNDTGFAKLKAQMLADTAQTWRVFFPPGAYTYQNNRWLFGVQRVIIEAYGCTFQCTINDAWEQNSRPLNNRDPFDDVGDVARTGANDLFTSGYTFGTASAGVTSITTTTHADAGNFSAGMRVLLHGYDQQGTNSYLPNLRYFEYKIVLTANAGSGVVTFTNPLAYFYDSRWWETNRTDGNTITFGAPRILSLERANYKQAKLQWFKGMTWLANSVNAAFNAFYIVADIGICEDVTWTDLISGGSARLIFKRCKGTGANAAGPCELDKIIEEATIEDSVMDATALGGGAGTGGGTGIVSFTLRRVRSYGNVNASSRHLLVDDCDIIPLPAQSQGVNTSNVVPSNTVCVRNTRIYNTGSVGVGVSVNAPLNFTIGTVNGTDIQLTWNGTSQALAYAIDYGMTLKKNDGTNPGRITAIYYSSASGGILVISGTWSAPTPSDTWIVPSNCISMSDGGGNSIIGVQPSNGFWGVGTASQVTYADSSVTNLAITNQVTFPSTANTYIQNANGMQFVVNGLGICYMQFGQINMIGAALVAFGAGGTLQFSEGTNGTQGVAVLVGGTKTVATTKATAGSRIYLTSQVDGGTPGFLRITNINAGVGFTITSSNGADTSTVAWLITHF